MMTTVLLWLSILAVWTPQSLAQANVCPCVTTTEGVTVMVSSFGAGANVTYMCLDNFLPISGNALRTCQSNGTWTGSPLMCDRVVTYLADLRVAGPVFSVISLTLFGNRSSSPTINLRLVSWGFFARGVRIPIRSPDVGLVQRAVVEAFTGIRFPSSFLTLQLFVTAPNGARFTFPTTSLTGGDVRDLPATLV